MVLLSKVGFSAELAKSVPAPGGPRPLPFRLAENVSGNVARLHAEMVQDLGDGTLTVPYRQLSGANRLPSPPEV
jgi:hypothetical protein